MTTLLVVAPNVFLRFARATGLVVVIWGCARQDRQIEAHTDRQAYVLGPGDSVAIVHLTVQNRSTQPLYFQTADARADILLLVRVDARGKMMIGADTAEPEIWSVFVYPHAKPNPTPVMGMARLGSDSVLPSTYTLPRGHYRVLVHFGDGPETPDKHGLWLHQFSIR